jgi:SAM-dependent methyltransferase
MTDADARATSVTGALDGDTLERLVPDSMDPADTAGAETLALHMERYEFAARHARPGRVLDCACGVGYGTRLLADRVAGLQEAVGVDISPAAVDYAQGRYGDETLRYVHSDALAFSDGGGFDTIISLETVEHVTDPEALLSHLASLLRPDGVMICSVPTTPSVDLNPHHLHDFTPASFREMGTRRGFEVVDELLQVQRVGLAEIWGEQRFKRENLRPNLPAYYLTHPAALMGRIATTLRFGLANHYLTLVWQRHP